jgi:hypothetical protein
MMKKLFARLKTKKSFSLLRSFSGSGSGQGRVFESPVDF